MNAIFIDTNILLHFTTFDELPLTDLVGGEFKVIFPPIILDELDKHKNHPNSKTAKRSRMIAAKLISFMKGERGRLTVEILKERPKGATFDKFNLDQKHQDDCLLASILEYKSFNSNHSVLLITDDLMALARSETFDIKTYQLGEEFRLAEPVDEQTKTIEKLKNENSQLKDKVPQVDLYFENKLPLLKVELQTNLKSQEEIRNVEIAKVKRETPLMTIEIKKEAKTPFDIIAGLNSNLLSDDRKIAYNAKVEEYYREYEQYLVNYYSYAVNKLQSIELQFMIVNDGNVPAQDIDIWIHLPDGFEASDKRKKAPKQPEPPYRPKHNFDMQGHDFFIGDLAGRLNYTPSAPRINFDAPSIKKTNSYEITYHCKVLKHHMNHSFDKIFIQYDSFETMKNFTIDYKLNIANVPNPVKGQLHVIFKNINNK